MTLHCLQCIIIVFEWCCFVGCCCWWCYQTQHASNSIQSFDIYENTDRYLIISSFFLSWTLFKLWVERLLVGWLQWWLLVIDVLDRWQRQRSHERLEEWSWLTFLHISMFLLGPSSRSKQRQPIEIQPHRQPSNALNHHQIQHADRTSNPTITREDEHIHLDIMIQSGWQTTPFVLILIITNNHK